MNLRNIQFFAEDTEFKPKRKTLIRKWIVLAITEEKFSELGPLNLIFCSDEYLLKINTTYLNHDTYTDIITFDNSSEEREISGDVFISIERVIDNSDKYSVSFQDELHRVIIHGVLHLCGYPDKTPQQQHIMREKENYYLSLLRTL